MGAVPAECADVLLTSAWRWLVKRGWTRGDPERFRAERQILAAWKSASHA
jgi:hypothetical protein